MTRRADSAQPLVRGLRSATSASVPKLAICSLRIADISAARISI